MFSYYSGMAILLEGGMMKRNELNLAYQSVHLVLMESLLKFYESQDSFEVCVCV